jgi:iron complex outermembrane receptor protein
MNKTIAILSLILLPLHATGAEAENEIDRLMPLSLDELLNLNVSISTHSKQQMSKAPSVVSLITAEDIAATGATNLMDILSSVPGLYVKRNLFGFRPLIALRGSLGAHTLLMLNGAPIRDLVWANGIFWKGLPASAIDRIEVIRGPGSALFGADASAGVINVITRTAAPMQGSDVGLRAGSYDSTTGWLRHGTTWNGYDIGLTAELSSTDGHRPYIAQAASGTSGVTNYGWNSHDIRFSVARDNWRFLVDSMRHDDLATGINGAGVMDPLNRSSDSQYGLAWHYDNPVFVPDWGLSASAYYRDLSYSSGNGFIAPTASAPSAREFLDAAKSQTSVEVSGLYSGIARHALRVGGGVALSGIYHVRQVNPPDPAYPMPEKNRRNAFIYLQDVWSLQENLELTAGLRHDEFSDFGSALTPRLALVWQGTDRLTTKLMYGEAFRAPSYQELYFKTAANTPNPNLAPERSKTWELAFEYLASGNLKLGLNLYRFEQRDMIAADATPARQFQNFGGFKAHGAELEAHWQATPALGLSGNLSHREDDDSTLRDVNAPTDSAYLRMDWAFQPRWNWDLQVNGYAARRLAAGDPRRPLGAFSLVDTTLRYRHDKNWEFAAALRNLFDTQAWDYSSRALVDNLPLPGRNGYVELRYTF